MKIGTRASALALILSTAVAGFALATPAAAQDENEIVVRPYITEHTSRSQGRVYRGQTTVTTRGLDLRYDADVEALQDRVSYTARVLCEDIEDAMRGASGTSDRQCVRGAVRGAQPQVREAVYRARY